MNCSSTLRMCVLYIIYIIVVSCAEIPQYIGAIFCLFSLETLVCLLCVGVDLVRQNSITQQILAKYLQKRLDRAGGNVLRIGQPQLLSTGNDLQAGAQKNDAESLYDEAAEDDDIIGDVQLYQGQKKMEQMHFTTHIANFDFFFFFLIFL